MKAILPSFAVLALLFFFALPTDILLLHLIYNSTLLLYLCSTLSSVSYPGGGSSAPGEFCTLFPILKFERLIITSRLCQANCPALLSQQRSRIASPSIRRKTANPTFRSMSFQEGHLGPILREACIYQNRWISGKFPNSLWPPLPGPFSGKNVAIFSGNSWPKMPFLFKAFLIYVFVSQRKC